MKWVKRLAEIEHLRAKHGKSRPNFMPCLKVEQRTAPCSDKIDTTPGRCQLPADAKQFPVGHCHKQGPVLLTPDAIKHDLMWYGGKKS